MPWSQGPEDKNPWEQNKNPWGKKHSSPPNIDAIIQNWQEKMRSGMPRGSGPLKHFFGPSGIFVAISLLIGVWLLTGVYRVQPGQNGVELIFGALNEVTEPGLHYNLPAPIGNLILPEVERSRRINIGYEPLNANSDAIRDIPKQSFILTGDENIVDMDFTVFWKIRDPVAFLFNIRQPEGTIQLAAESVMREVIGQTTFDQAVTSGREDIEFRSQSLLQNVLDSYGTGVEIESVVLQKSDPPSEVIDAFNDVQRARQDRDRQRNEAEAYANSIVPSARGQAEQLIRTAEAYRERLINEAVGEASRFSSVLESYKNAPEIIRKRMYLETISNVLKDSNKIIMNQEGGGVVPILPLPELLKQKK
jgi:membrane protease subunit HflK